MSFGEMDRSEQFVGFDLEYPDMTHSLSSDMDMEGSLSHMMGDFYNEPHNVTRGLTLYDGTADFSSSYPGPSGAMKLAPFENEFDQQGFFLPEKLCTPAIIQCSEPSSSAKGQPVAPTLMLDDGCEPPMVPCDAPLAVTSISFGEERSPVELGNQIIHFLAEVVGVVINKVNSKKFTLKAEGFVDGHQCALKVRLYRRLSLDGGYVAEMQRRSGDCIAFNRLYRRCSEYMTACTNSPEQSPHQFTEEVLPEIPAENTSLEPMLDLAENMEDVQLQAEVVLAMSQMVKEADIAVQLCTPQAFLLFQKMLQIVCFSVAQPLAQLLCCLAHSPEAAEFFAQQELLQAMIDKVSATRSTSQPTAEQLAQAVRLAISNCAADLPIQAKRELTTALTRALQCSSRTDRYDALIAGSLQESLHTLSLCETPVQ